MHFKKPLIYLITKGETTAQNFEEKSGQILDIVRVAVDENIPLVQLRETQLPTRLLLELAWQIVELTKGSNTKLLVNDRADVAFAAGADGVHLTTTSIGIDVIRTAFPPNFVIGISTHTTEEVVAAANLGADFAVFGPVFDTPGKGEPKGTRQLLDVCSVTEDFPVIALGGIDGTNYGSILEAGASGFAAIRWLNDASNLRFIARTLNK